MQFTPPSVPRKPSAWLALGWLATLILVASIAPARVSAHAELVTSDPIANSSLVEAPSTLTVTFSEPIDPDRASIEVLDLQLRPVAGVGPARVDPEGVTVTLDLPVLDPDVYTVRYDVVSTTDGHTTSGFYAFIVDPTGAQAPPSSTPTASSPSADAWAVAARWLSLLGTLIGLGTLVTWWHSGRPLGLLMPWRLVAVSSFVGAGALAVYLVLSARTIPPGPGGLPFDPAAAFGWTPFAVAMRVALLGGLVAGSLAILGAIRGSRHRSVVGRRRGACGRHLAGGNERGRAWIVPRGTRQRGDRLAPPGGGGGVARRHPGDLRHGAKNRDARPAAPAWQAGPGCGPTRHPDRGRQLPSRPGLGARPGGQRVRQPAARQGHVGQHRARHRRCEPLPSPRSRTGYRVPPGRRRALGGGGGRAGCRDDGDHPASRGPPGRCHRAGHSTRALLR